MIAFETLCARIFLPLDMRRRTIEAHHQIDYPALEAEMEMLFHRETWEAGRNELTRKLGDDPDGRKILACMLQCARKSEALYRTLGIPETIFDATFRCFSRFVEEHRTSYGTEAFDRDWWTAHQISLQLFRLGELEYEMTTLDDKAVVSIHIPSDAVLQTGELRKSVQQANAFFAVYFPNYKDVPYICHSWLLEPALAQVLPPTSHIRSFQRSFTIDHVDYGARDFIEWVFKNPNLPMKDLPEDTTLQRNLKHYLLSGGDIGEALGILVAEPFSDS